jgi:hypothetical protein
VEKLISIEIEAGQPWDSKLLDLLLLISLQCGGLEVATEIYQKVSAYHSKYLSPDFGIPSHAKWVLELPLKDLLKSTMQNWEEQPFGPKAPILRAQFALLAAERRDLHEGKITPITTLGGYTLYILDIIDFESDVGYPYFRLPPPAPREVYEKAAAFYCPVALDTLPSGDRDCALCELPLTAGGFHEVCRLPCGHIFGLVCVSKFVTGTPQCPTCNCDYTTELQTHAFWTPSFNRKIEIK